MIFTRRHGATGKPPKHWSDALQALFGGVMTQSGVPVTEEKALSLSTVWTCVRILSDALGVLPLHVYRKLPDGGKERVPEHPVDRLLSIEPNQEMTPSVWKRLGQTHIATWGNSYNWIRRDNRLRPIELIPLPAHSTQMRRVDGRLVCETIVQGRQATLEAMDVTHVFGLSLDGISGLTPMSYHQETIGLGLAAQSFGANFFENGATLSGYIQLPGRSSDLQKLKESWNALYSGLGNAFRTAVLENGAEYKQIGISPNDAQMLETRRFQKNEIATIYNIPLHMVNDYEGATFSNIEQLSLEFVKYTMMTYITAWEEELNRKLFREAEKGTYFVKFNLDALLRADISTRNKAYSDGRNGGWLSINDIRAKEDLNPIEGGDTYLQPLNMSPVGQPLQDTSEDEPQPNQEEQPNA